MFKLILVFITLIVMIIIVQFQAISVAFYVVRSNLVFIPLHVVKSQPWRARQNERRFDVTTVLVTVCDAPDIDARTSRRPPGSRSGSTAPLRRMSSPNCRQVLFVRRRSQVAFLLSQVFRLRRGACQPVVVLRTRRKHLLQRRLHQVRNFMIFLH
jgi:hypothetical protein